MKIRIPEPTSWRPDGSRLFAFGDYRVPEDMSQALAEQAVADGAASWVEESAEAASAPSKRKPKPPPG